MLCSSSLYLSDEASRKLEHFLIGKRMLILPCRAVCIVSFCIFGAFTLTVYYLSEAYQAVYHTSATGAGIRLLPLILVQIFFLIASSRVVQLVGRLKPVIVIGPCFVALGTGLLYSIKYDTPSPEAHLYGYQAILGTGIGLCLQNTSLVVQFELKSEPWLISAGTGLVIFSKSITVSFPRRGANDDLVGFIGRILGISLAGSIFENMIQRNLHHFAPTLSPELVQVVTASASAVWTAIPDVCIFCSES